MAAQFGRRFRRGATTTALAAIAMAALTASQAPELLEGGGQGRATGSTSADDTPIDGGSPHYTDLPPLETPGKPRTPIQPPAVGDAEAGIPATVLAAYKRAEAALADSHPGCNLPWELLAAIGKVESGQARGGALDSAGTTLQPILGPQLNGDGFANITDTDGGTYDEDSRYDRAVGPMQFIPSTWATWGADGDGDGGKNPHNIYDAALAAGNYLCADGRDLSVPAELDRAILGYNHSREYLRTVLSWLEYYKKGTHEVPDGSGVLPADRSGTGSGDGRRDGSPRTPSPTPSERERGDKPSTPAPGGSGKPDPASPSPDPASPSPDPASPSPTRPPSSGEPAPLRSLVRLGAREITAVAGGTFAEPPRVRAENSDGKPVKGVRVRFAIVGETGARFPGDATGATVTTAGDGTAAAPALTAGAKTGSFTVRATVVGGGVPATEFAASVTAPVPDKLARTSDTPLTATANSSFANAVEVLATYQDRPVADLPMTATVIDPATGAPVENGEGPYFEDGEGRPVHALGGLTTDAEGRLKLPQILTDEQTGTFLLRLTPARGPVLDVRLTVG